MFGPNEGTSLRVQQEESEETKDAVANKPLLSKQESNQSQKSNSVYFKRGSHPNLPGLMKATAAATPISTIQVAEINLATSSRNR